MIKILFITANPANTPRLFITEEVRQIDLAIQQTPLRDKISHEVHGAVRINDLQYLLLRYKPDIVHFSGHGTDESELVLQDEAGNGVPVPPEALSELFRLLKGNIKCVVLNACYSAAQAGAIGKYIGRVIGMSDAISDVAAREFSVGFYRAIGYDEGIQRAFEFGLSQLSLHRLPAADLPILLNNHQAIDTGGPLFVPSESDTPSNDNGRPGDDASTATKPTNANPSTPALNPNDMVWTFLNQIIIDTSSLSLAAVDTRTARHAEEHDLSLAEVYTELDVVLTSEQFSQGEMAGLYQDDNSGERTRQDDEQGCEQGCQQSEVDEREAYRPVIEFVNGHKYAVLLGEPGSGKSSVARFVALCLAGARLQATTANLARLGPNWTLGAILPLLVTLRDLLPVLASDSGESTSFYGDALLSDLFIQTIIERMGPSMQPFNRVLRQKLVEEESILVLDGLDEVPPGERGRSMILRAIQLFMRQFPRTRILLTCRTYAYQNPQDRLAGFDIATLAPFSGHQITSFIQRWYQSVATVRSDLKSHLVDQYVVDLNRAIENSPHLSELAPRPLLLTMIASLHSVRGTLPHHRIDLYAASIDLLLNQWERPKVVLDQGGQVTIQSASAEEWFQMPRKAIIRMLEEVAFTVHANSTSTAGAADITEEALFVPLMRLSTTQDGSEMNPTEVLDYIRDRAGLLNDQGDGTYAFPHRSIQEYLAACYLTREHFPHKLVELVIQDPERWREVLLMAGAKTGQGTPFAVWALVDRLCPFTIEECRDAKRNANDDPEITLDEWLIAALVGKMLVETGAAGHDYNSLYNDALSTSHSEGRALSRVKEWLHHIAEHEILVPTDRSMAVTQLGYLGDPRVGVGLVDSRLPDIEWIEIEAGPFKMGAEQAVDRMLAVGFEISRYPITVAQFGAFRRAGGYANPAYWRDDGWSWLNAKPDQHAAPERYPGWQIGPNHPQTGICWYEAMAFCRWFSEASGDTVTLPTEAQWERTARHTDGRSFPWGERFSLAACNMRSTGIGHSSPVGIFPSGNAHSGVADMAGNVWEWCLSHWNSHYDFEVDMATNHDQTPMEEERARRAQRGGSSSNERRLIRSAYRHRNYMDQRSYNVGFRIVRLP